MEKKNQEIIYWDRQEKIEKIEKIVGEKTIKWIYQSKLGRFFLEKIFLKSLFNWVFGIYQSSWFSRFQIPFFVRSYQIPIQEYEQRRFYSFNDFFSRRFKFHARRFVQEAHQFPACAEGRYLAWKASHLKEKFLIKGIKLDLQSLLGCEKRALPFLGGAILIARLCPVDYHRFHFPDEGEILERYALKGSLHSVNPFALNYKNDIFMVNERQVSILKTKNFGKLAYIEVGALLVGKIIQTYSQSYFQRGQEKGYFLFGASTVVILGEPGLWTPSLDLLEQTHRGKETLVRLGEEVGLRAIPLE